MNRDDWLFEEYKQQSEDWRHRDRTTWQIPTVLIVIGGASIFSAFTVSDNETVKNIILLIGLLFSWVFTIAFARGIYLQGLSLALLENIKNDRYKENTFKCVARMPLHDESMTFFIAIMFFVKPITSICLLLLCCGIVGIFFKLIWSDCSGIIVFYGFLASLINIFLVVLLSHFIFNNVDTNENTCQNKALKISAVFILTLVFFMVGLFGFMQILFP